MAGVDLGGFGFGGEGRCDRRLGGGSRVAAAASFPRAGPPPRDSSAGGAD